LPDEVNWRDEGCEVFGSCLNCPLPRCVEEEPRGQQRLRLAARDRRVVELRRSGKSVKDIAGLFGVSRRTVERALRAESVCHSEPFSPCHSDTDPEQSEGEVEESNSDPSVASLPQDDKEERLRMTRLKIFEV